VGVVVGCDAVDVGSDVVVVVGAVLVEVVGPEAVEVVGFVGVPGPVVVGPVDVGSVGTDEGVAGAVGTSVEVALDVPVTPAVDPAVVVDEALGSTVTSDRGGTAGGMTTFGAGARSR
jgi:hypothetical protein